jgi:hypothetical protein
MADGAFAPLSGDAPSFREMADGLKIVFVTDDAILSILSSMILLPQTISRSAPGRSKRLRAGREPGQPANDHRKVARGVGSAIAERARIRKGIGPAGQPMGASTAPAAPKSAFAFPDSRATIVRTA